jgi:hypothetical protein
MKKIIKKKIRTLLLYSYNKKNRTLNFLFQICLVGVIFFSNLNIVFTSKKKLLFLSHQRFRGDIEIINQEFCGFTIPFFLQTFFLYLAFEHEKKIEIYDFFSKTNKDRIRKRKKHRQLIDFYLIPVFKFFNIRVIISPSIHYIQDIDIGITAKHQGMKFLIFHRENLTILPDQIKVLTKLYSNFDKIPTDLVVFHNKSARKIFLQSKLLLKKQTTILGALRMDDFIKNINTKNNGKIISFFSFHKISYILKDVMKKKHNWDRFKHQKKGWNKLWDYMHIKFFELARNNPNTKFIIKTKGGGNWILNIENLWMKKFKQKSLPNLNLTSDLNTHDIINKSKFILGFNSTVLLEAGLRKIPIFVPDFYEVKKLNQHVLHESFNGSFIKIKNMNELQEALDNEHLKFYPTKKMMQKRKYFFQKYVNPLELNLKRKYFSLINMYLQTN